MLVDDRTKVYAIFAENMLETTQSVGESNKLKGASYLINQNTKEEVKFLFGVFLDFFKKILQFNHLFVIIYSNTTVVVFEYNFYAVI